MNKPDSTLFFNFFDQIPESVLICNAAGNILFINQLASKKFGVTPEEAQQKEVADLDSAVKDPSVWSKILDELRAFGAMTYMSELCHQQTNDCVPVEVNLKYYEHEGDVYLIISSRDVQKRVETEKALARSKVVMEQSSKLARVGGWDLDLVNQKLYWTSMTREIHEVPDDYEPDFKTGINFYKEGASRDFMIADMTAAIQHGAPLGIAEVELVTARDRTIWVRCVGEVIRKDGQAVRVFGSIQDIDEQKRVELKLEQSLHLLEQLTRNVPGAVYQIELKPDQTLHCPFVSAGIRYMFPDMELPETGDLDTFLNEVIHLEEIKYVKAAILKSAETMESLEIDFSRGKEGQLRYFQTSARPEAKADGTIVWHGYLWDISESRKRREELKHFAEVTSEQNKRLLSFTYIVSHNVRSHVANLLGILNILKNDDEKTRETFIPLMHESVYNLDESLRNLNDIVNIQTQMNLTRKPIKLHEVLEKTMLNLKLAINHSEAEIQNLVPKSFKLKTNAAYLDSILLNLLSNAIKYRSSERKPKIEVGIEINGPETILYVSDNGLGIDLEKHKHVVFGMYKTFHKNKDAKGLGLFITKTQVEALGGKIDLESEVNKGTVVRVYFYE